MSDSSPHTDPAGPLPDRETFERVWKRVMPDQAFSPVEPIPSSPVPALSPAPPPLTAVTLQDLMDLALLRAAAFQALARRSLRHTSQLQAMAQRCRSQFCRLSTAWFLLSGQRYRPRVTPPPLSPSPALALRRQYLTCREWDTQCRAAAARASDPGLSQLLSLLAEEGRDQADAIRSMLEQMCPPPCPLY